MIIDTQHLLQRLKDSDTKAFRMLYDTHYAALCMFAFRIVRDKHYAEELVQDAFIKLWNMRADVESESKVRGFLFVDVRNKAYNLIQSATYRKTDIGIDEDTLAQNNIDAPDHTLYRNTQIHIEIWKEVDNLPKREKEILNLLFRHGMKTTEVAELLGISESTVRNQKMTGLTKLRAHFGNHIKSLDIELLLILSAWLLEERISTLI